MFDKLVTILPTIVKLQSQRFAITVLSLYLFWKSGVSPWCAVAVAIAYIACVTIEKIFKKNGANTS